MTDPERSEAGDGMAPDIARLLKSVAERRDPFAAERLVNLCAGRLLGLAFRILSDREAAEDVVQDLFLGLLAGKVRYRGRGRPEAFLLRVTSCIAIDRAKRIKTGRRKEEEAMALRGVRSGATGALDSVLEKELEAEIAGLLGTLEPEARAALALRFWGDATVRDVSRILAVSRATAHRWIEGALEKLRRPLMRKGFGAAMAVTILGKLMRGMDPPPPSPGFLESVAQALRAGKAPSADLPAICESFWPPAILSWPILGAAIIAAAFTAVLILAPRSEVPPAGPKTGADGPASGSGPAVGAGRAGGPRKVATGAGKELPGSVVLEGVIRAPGGGPAGGARVRLYPGEGRFPPDYYFAAVFRDPPLAEAAADARGRFAFRGHKAGSYRILVVTQGSGPGMSGLLRLGAGESLGDIRIDLPSGGVVEGRCRLESGDPGEGVRIEAWIPIRAGETIVGYWPEGASSGADGRIRLSGVGASGAEITVRADRHHVAAAPRRLQGGEGSFEIVLSDGASASGKVVDPEGQPAAGAEVLAFASPEEKEPRPWSPWLLARKTVADGEGRFELLGLPPGESTLFARKSGFAVSEPLEVEPPGEPPSARGLVLSLRNGEPIEGRCISGEKPFGPATGMAAPRPAEAEADRDRPVFLLDARALDPASSRLDAVAFPVDAEGRFETPPLAPGEYVLGAYQGLRRLLGYSIFAVEGQETPRPPIFRAGQRGVEVEVPADDPVLIAGKVVDEKGRGVPDARLQCSFHLGGGYTSLNLFTDQRGAFELEHIVEPGAFEHLGISATAPGGGRGSTGKVPLADRERLRSLEVLVDSGVAIAGSVRTFSGQPVAGAAVTLRQDGSRPWPQVDPRQMNTDAAGRFRFAAIEAGRKYRVAVQAEGWALTEVPGLEPGAVDVDLVLSAEATIHGRVVDLDGDPVEPASFSIIRYRDGSVESREIAFRAEGDGKFTIRSLESGRYGIVARGKASPGGRQPVSRESEPATVAEGQTVEGIVLVMTRLVAVVGTVVDGITGNPVPGAVVADWDPDSSHFPAGRLKVTADGDGRFRLEGIPRGRLEIHAAAEGHLKARKLVEVSGEEDGDVRIELPPARDLVVRAIGEDGKPIAGAQVQCGFLWPPPSEGLLTDASGLARVPVGASGFQTPQERSKAWIQVWTEEHAPQRIELTPAQIDEGRIEVMLRRAGRLLGKVVDHQGMPVVNLEVVARRNGRGIAAKTGEGGEFEIPGLESGEYEVTVTSEEIPLPRIVRNASVSAGRESRLDLAFGDPATFSFFPVRIAAAFEDGRPAAGAGLRVNGGWTGSAQVEPLPCFRARDLQAGTDGWMEVLFEEPIEKVYFHGDFQADGELFQPSATSADVAGGQASVVFRRMPRGEIILRVLDARTEKPISRYEVYLRTKDGGRNGGTRDAPDGEVRWKVPPGEQTIEVRAEGHRPAEKPVAVEDHGRTSVEVRLERDSG
jgi:RNA polymerase sigma-70 factor (ECF subfamily)